MGYAGLFNSSYHPSPLEEFFISAPSNQLGPVQTGQIVVALLQGMMFVQYRNYIGDFLHEKKWTKWLVHLTFALCLAKFAYVWFLSWNKFVPHYGDWAYLATFSPISVPIGISSTIPSAVCQIFFIHRCWALSRNMYFAVPAVISLLLTVGAGISLTYGAALEAGGDIAVTKAIIISANVSLASALVCDIFITSFTCYYLIRERTGFTETDSLIMRLVKCSIESVAGPTVVAFVNLVLSNYATDNSWFLLPNLALAHVYGCSLLYSANARKSMRMRTPVSSGHTRVKTRSRNNGYHMQDRSLNTMPGVFVEVQTDVHEEHDLHTQRRYTTSNGKVRPFSGSDDPFARDITSNTKPEYAI